MGRFARNMRNPSGRKCDLLQPGGPKKAMQVVYFKHWDPMGDLLYRMGLFGEGHWGPCQFCQKRFATMFLGEGVRPHFLKLVVHHTFHKDDYIERHPICRYIHMVTSLVCLHLGKGTCTQYTLIKGILRHQPEQVLGLIGNDCNAETDPSRPLVFRLEDYCIRALSVPYLKDLVFELAAYKTFYEMFRTHIVTRNQKRHHKMKAQWTDLTDSIMIPGGDGRPL